MVCGCPGPALLIWSSIRPLAAACLHWYFANQLYAQGGLAVVGWWVADWSIQKGKLHTNWRARRQDDDPSRCVGQFASLKGLCIGIGCEQNPPWPSPLSGMASSSPQKHARFHPCRGNGRLPALSDPCLHYRLPRPKQICCCMCLCLAAGSRPLSEPRFTILAGWVWCYWASPTSVGCHGASELSLLPSIWRLLIALLCSCGPSRVLGSLTDWHTTDLLLYALSIHPPSPVLGTPPSPREQPVASCITAGRLSCRNSITSPLLTEVPGHGGQSACRPVPVNLCSFSTDGHRFVGLRTNGERDGPGSVQSGPFPPALPRTAVSFLLPLSADSVVVLRRRKPTPRQRGEGEESSLREEFPSVSQTLIRRYEGDRKAVGLPGRKNSWCSGPRRANALLKRRTTSLCAERGLDFHATVRRWSLNLHTFQHDISRSFSPGLAFRHPQWSRRASRRNTR